MFGTSKSVIDNFLGTEHGAILRTLKTLKTSRVVVVRAKAKMQNILSKKSLEKTKQIQPCCLTYYTKTQLGTSPKIWSTPKTFRKAKIEIDTKK